MKIFIIRLNEELYVNAVLFSTKGLEIIPTFDKEDAAWYEEDKAKGYCEMLNNQDSMKEANFKFTIEEVKK